MNILPLKIIADADTRIPNALPAAKKLDWLGRLEARIRLEVKRIYDEYTLTVTEDKPYLLPFSEEQIEWVFFNGNPVPKIDLRSAEGLQKGVYRFVFRSLPEPLTDAVIADAHATFSADGITFSKPHPFETGDLIGISGTADNNVTATVIGVNGVTITTDYAAFTQGETSATVCKVNDRPMEIPEQHPCFGIYEEYLCMELARHLADAERFRLAEDAFTALWEEYARLWRQTAPQTPAAKVRGV